MNNFISRMQFMCSMIVLTLHMLNLISVFSFAYASNFVEKHKNPIAVWSDINFELNGGITAEEITSLTSSHSHKLPRGLVVNLFSNKTLTELYLGSNRISSLELEVLKDALINDVVLEVLDLQNNLIDEHGANEIALVLAQNKKLRVLVLTGNKIGDAGVKSIAESVSENTSLTELHLGNTSFTIVEDLAKMLKNNKVLIHLSLSENKLNDGNVKVLASAIKEAKALTSLDLQKNLICGDGFCDLADMLKENTKMVALDLRNNRPNADGLRVLEDVVKFIATSSLRLTTLVVHPSLFVGTTAILARNKRAEKLIANLIALRLSASDPASPLFILLPELVLLINHVAIQCFHDERNDESIRLRSL